MGRVKLLCTVLASDQVECLAVIMMSKLGGVEGRGQPSCAHGNLLQTCVPGVAVGDKAGDRIPLSLSCYRARLKISPPRVVEESNQGAPGV